MESCIGLFKFGYEFSWEALVIIMLVGKVENKLKLGFCVVMGLVLENRRDLVCFIEFLLRIFCCDLVRLGFLVFY